MTLCCAANCPNRSFQKVMKKLPKDKELRAKWIHQINRPNFKFGPNHFICEIHFAPTQWANRAARRLKKDAVPTLFCHCSKKKLLNDDPQYSSSPLPDTGILSRVKTIIKMDHLYYDEKENQKQKNSKKRGRPSKGSDLEHEVGCPLKLRVIDHDYTMMLPMYDAIDEVVPPVSRNETIKLAVSEDSCTVQKPLLVDNICEESPNNIAVKMSSFSQKTSLTEHLSCSKRMEFDLLDEHSVGTIEISCSMPDSKKGNRNDKIMNKLRNKVIKLRGEKANFKIRLSKLQKKYDSLIKVLSGKYVGKIS